MSSTIAPTSASSSTSASSANLRFALGESFAGNPQKSLKKHHWKSNFHNYVPCGKGKVQTHSSLGYLGLYCFFQSKPLSSKACRVGRTHKTSGTIVIWGIEHKLLFPKWLLAILPSWTGIGGLHRQPRRCRLGVDCANKASRNPYFLVRASLYARCHKQSEDVNVHIAHRK